MKETITTCLEEPFHEVLKTWLEIFRNQAFTKIASEIVAEIKEIRKHFDFEKSNPTTSIYGLQGSSIDFIIPDNVKDFLFG